MPERLGQERVAADGWGRAGLGRGAAEGAARRGPRRGRASGAPWPRRGGGSCGAAMADLEAVLADVSYLMAMEKSKAAPAARASKKVVLPEPRYGSGPLRPLQSPSVLSRPLRSLLSPPVHSGPLPPSPVPLVPSLLLHPCPGLVAGPSVCQHPFPCPPPLFPL